MHCSRRGFLGKLAAFGGLYAVPALGDILEPKLRFGVVSDVHIGGRKESPARLAFALRWLRERHVDAVLFPGDIAHTGRISQMEAFARVWFEVFPDGCGFDGRKVELMISTGNHDAWTLGYDKATEADRRANWLIQGDNLARTWKRLFGLTWSPVWRRTVKGYVFLGSEWPTLKPGLERYMREHGAEFDRTKPFFHCQHEHPKHTCHGAYGCGWDQGQVARAFADFPNAVVFSGHSHCSLADERTVWQGAFTSIGAGCLHEGGGSFDDYENISAFWHPSIKTHVMAPMNDPDKWGGDPDGGCFELVEVHDGWLRIERRSSVWNMPIGSEWTVPLPARTDGPHDHERLAVEAKPPEFPTSATVSATACLDGHPLSGESFRRVACVQVSFPAARGGSGRRRVFDYEVRVVAQDGRSVIRRIMAPGFSVPEEKSDRPGDCLFLLSELPAADGFVFEVTPRDCFGNRGAPIRSEPFALGSVPAFTMRIDDNQAVADWRRVAEIFERHGMRCSFAVVPNELSEEQGACLRELAARGHVIMDHTPHHTFYRLTYRDRNAFDRVKREPFVQEADEKTATVHFTCEVDESSPKNRRTRVRIDGDRLTFLDGCDYGLFGIFVRLSGEERLVGLSKKGNSYEMKDMWRRSLNPLPRDGEQDAIVYDPASVQPCDAVLRELARASRERFDHFGLPRPLVWVRPGGWDPSVLDVRLERVYGREFGYIGADAGVGAARGTTRWTRGFDRMHFFDQGVQVTPEGLVDEIQKRLADGHDHVTLSHMWRSSLPGGREEYFEKTERFVQMLADRQIPTRTMPELLAMRFSTDGR